MLTRDVIDILLQCQNPYCPIIMPTNPLIRHNDLKNNGATNTEFNL